MHPYQTKMLRLAPIITAIACGPKQAPAPVTTAPEVSAQQIARATEAVGIRTEELLMCMGELPQSVYTSRFRDSNDRPTLSPDLSGCFVRPNSVVCVDFSVNRGVDDRFHFDAYDPLILMDDVSRVKVRAWNRDEAVNNELFIPYETLIPEVLWAVQTDYVDQDEESDVHKNARELIEKLRSSGVSHSFRWRPDGTVYTSHIGCWDEACEVPRSYDAASMLDLQSTLPLGACRIALGRTERSAKERLAEQREKSAAAVEAAVEKIIPYVKANGQIYKNIEDGRENELIYSLRIDGAGKFSVVYDKKSGDLLRFECYSFYTHSAIDPMNWEESLQTMMAALDSIQESQE